MHQKRTCVPRERLPEWIGCSMRASVSICTRARCVGPYEKFVVCLSVKVVYKKCVVPMCVRVTTATIYYVRDALKDKHVYRAGRPVVPARSDTSAKRNYLGDSII